MGQLQSRIIDLPPAKIEQVEINGSRAISGVLFRAAESRFDSLQLEEELLGRIFVADLDHGIEKFLGAGFTFDRLGFVNVRGEKWGRDFWQANDALAGSR